MTNESKKFHIVNKAELSPAGNSLALKYATQDTAIPIEEMLKNSIPMEIALGKNSNEKLSLIHNLIKENFKVRGVEIENFEQVVLKGKSIYEMKARGSSNIGYVELFDSLIEDINLKQLVTFKALVHELYHSVSKYSISVRIDKKINDLDLTIDAAGAGYRGAHGNSALEEGSAVIFENEVFEKIKNLFPEETIDVYNNDIILGIQKNNRNNIDLNSDEITLFCDINKNKVFGDNYPYPLRLVKYLRSKILNFDSMLENLRVKRKSLDFARAIEQEFGKGYFNKIVTCTTENAQQLLEELKNVESKK